MRLWLYAVRNRLRGLLMRSRLERDLAEELRFHIERQAEVNREAGMTPANARFAALQELGGVEQIKEECRQMTRLEWLESFIQDVRFGFRTYRRRPGFTLCALMILGFGIGASTAVFSVVNRVLLNPLPYREPDRLLRIFGAWEHGSREGISQPDFLDFRTRSASFESLAGAGNSTPLLNLRGPGEPEQIRGRNVTASFFSTLGVRPLLGREFRLEDEAWRGPAVAMLSYGLWQRQFGGDPSIVGGPLTINGAPYTIVGVLPPFFNFLGPTEVFTPVQYNPAPAMRGIRTLIVIGRLKPNTDARRAQQELSVLARRFEEQYPQFDRGWSAAAVSLTDEVVKDVRPALLLLLGAVGLVVLLISANVASLVLCHAAGRGPEISVRVALGASRLRVARQVLTESLLLAVTGGILGCALAYWAVQAIKRFGPAGIPRLAEVSLDFRVLAFALTVSMGMGALFGLEPALAAGRLKVAEALKQGGRGMTARMRLRDLLVISEVAISVVLLIGASLLIRSLFRLESVNPGFQAAHLLTTRIALPGRKYNDGNGAKAATFWRDAVERSQEIPGVESAAVTSELPLSGLNNPTPRQAITSEGKSNLLYLRSVSPGYWNVMRIPLRAGRLLSREDRKNTPRVVVINEQFRKDVFGDRNPVGQLLTFDFQERAETENYKAIVVGVVGDVRHTSLAVAPFREAYLPLEQSPLFNYDLLVRSSVEPKTIAGALRKAIWAIDPDQSLGGLRTVDEIVDQGLAQPKFRGYLLGVFAALALILTAAGLYGLLNFLVFERKREIGIRMALGASSADILEIVLRKAGALTATGLIVGLSMALALAGILSNLVFGIRLADPATFVLTGGLLLLVAFVASYLPARRAISLNPIETLRCD